MSNPSPLHKRQQQFQADMLKGDESNERLQVYSVGYKLRLQEIIAIDFPVLKSWMGNKAFEAMTEQYLQLYISNHYNVRYISQWLAEFLASAEPYQQQPELHELAQFEWTLEDVREATEAEAFTVEQLQQVPAEAWPELQLAPHPSARCLQLQTNVADFWQAHKEQQPWPELTIDKQSHAWLFWRNDLIVHFTELDEVQYWVWLQIAAGANFATICEGLCAWEDEEQVAQRLLEIILPWINDSILIKNLLL